MITDEMTPVMEWTVRYRRTGSSDTTISPNSPHPANSMTKVLSGLDTATSYDVMIAASNSAGTGDFTTQTERTLVDCKYFMYCSRLCMYAGI